MSKGTASHGLRSRGKTHIVCRRCGERAYHAAHKQCASCGYGKSARTRGYNWQR